MTKSTPVKTKKTASKNRTGSKYVCGVCGLEVTIDRDCGCAETRGLICCDSPMLPRK